MYPDHAWIIIGIIFLLFICFCIAVSIFINHQTENFILKESGYKALMEYKNLAQNKNCETENTKEKEQ